MAEQSEHGQDPDFKPIEKMKARNKEEGVLENIARNLLEATPNCPKCRKSLVYVREGLDANGSPVQESYRCNACDSSYEPNQVL